MESPRRADAVREDERATAAFERGDVLLARLAVAFCGVWFAADVFLVDFLPAPFAVVFAVVLVDDRGFAVARFTVTFFAVTFFAVAFFAVAFLAVAFFAAVLDVELRRVAFFVMLFLAGTGDLLGHLMVTPETSSGPTLRLVREAPARPVTARRSTLAAEGCAPRRTRSSCS